MITANGKTHIADQLTDRTYTPVSLMAIGTGTPAANALGAEVSRRVCNRSHSGATATYNAHWDVDDQLAGTITEIGVFDNSGNMVASETCNVAKAANGLLDITINVPFL